MLRREMMLDPSNLHHEYYKQFALPSVMAAVKADFWSELRVPGKPDLVWPYKEIQLCRWDRLALCVPDYLFKWMGDYPSPSGRVRALKAAARRLLEENHE